MDAEEGRENTESTQPVKRSEKVLKQQGIVLQTLTR